LDEQSGVAHARSGRYISPKFIKKKDAPMKTKLINLALASAFAFSAGSAVAEEAFSGSWYVMPGIGLMHTDSDLRADDDSAAYSFRIGKELSEHWDVQIGGSYAKADEDDRAFTGGEYKQTLFGVDALYMLSRDSFRPFLLAGLGLARNKIDYDPGNVGDSKTSWMANVGAGFQYHFNEVVGLQADIRHVWSRAKDDTDTLFSDDKTVGNTYLNFGVLFKFGAPKKVAAAEPVEPVAPAMQEVAPVDEEPLPALQEAEPAAEVGPDKPAFEKITLSAEVLFDFDKANLRQEGKSILDTEVVEKMKAHPEVELVLITGHTDRIGTDSYNQKLSERRAASVKNYLVSQGIEESRLHAVGKGETEPVVDCKGVYGKKAIDCLQPNRRVVVEVEAQRQSEK
jgi:OOP family OmpA-OmpF porin